MGIIFAGISPHPPIIIPEIGKEEVVKAKNTKAALNKLAQKLVAINPDTVVVISPHGPVFQDGITLNGTEKLQGNFTNFGVTNLDLSFANDVQLLREIERECGKREITALEMNQRMAEEYGISLRLDHGALVPLYYFNRAGFQGSVVSVTMGLLSYAQLYSFGIGLQKAAEKADRKVAVIASGDLSHCLTKDAPAGFTPEGEVFDKRLVDALDKFNIIDLAEIEEEIVERAGECGLRPIFMMLGSIDGYKVESEIISYEGPFGVGYLIAAFNLISKDASLSLGEAILLKEQKKVKKKREGESTFVNLARRSLEHYVMTGRKLKLKELGDKQLADKAGVFVSIKKDGHLRGCIGTTSPTMDNLAEEIVENAISAGTRDPRFFPIEEDELDSLIYSVDSLSPAESIDSLDQLDVKKYGVIVRSQKGNRVGLLLPNLEGIDSVEEQVRIAKDKAGIGQDEFVKLERFEVVRYY